jgi:uncharacterized protein YegP (UPF0339 family)
MGKFIISPAKSGIKFVLKAGNNEVIAQSQMYKTINTAMGGVKSVIRNAPIAALEDQTVEDFEVQKNPKFEVYVDKAGEFRFRLKAKNGQIIAVGQGYKAKKSVLNGIESIRKNAAEGNIVQDFPEEEEEE